MFKSLTIALIVIALVSSAEAKRKRPGKGRDIFADLFGDKGKSKETESFVDEDGYEDNLTATYGAVAAAPNVGSMEMTVPDSSPPTSPAPEPVQTGPPVPAAGLPEGWTLDQWKHYGTLGYKGQLVRA